MTDINIDWNFPDSNNGEVEGLNNPGIETFKGHHAALGREMIQNSLDASSGKEAVRVEFTLIQADKATFPGFENLLNVLHNCKEYWDSDTKTVNFFDRAISQCTKQNISMLRISDYNTTGLTGSDKNRGGNWNNLVKSSGATQKEGDKTGSFGIGKNAAFNASNMRTVFYSTYDIDNKFAFQGVSKLVTHNKQDTEKRGTGYFGHTLHNTAVLDNKQVSPYFYEHRPNKEPGTDVFITDYYKDAGWDHEIIESVLSSFFQVIHNEKLEVLVNDCLINSETLPIILEEYNKREQGKFIPFSLYKALVHGTVVSTEIDPLGKVELRIYCNDINEDNDYLPSKVALTRNGMTIRTDRAFKVRLDYAAVFNAIDEKGNAFLRELEPPQHNRWMESLYEEDEALAKRVMKKLYKWIGDELRKISDQFSNDASDAFGMGQYLPGEDNDSGFKSNQDKNLPGKDRAVVRSGFESPVRNNIKMKKRKKNKTAEPGTEPNDSSSNKQPIQQPSADKKKSKPKSVPVEMKKVRVLCLDANKGLYRVIINTQTDNAIYIGLKTVAEDNGKNDTEILSAKNMKTEEIYIINTHDIGPIQLEKDCDTSVDVILNSEEKYALEVLAHEIIG